VRIICVRFFECRPRLRWIIYFFTRSTVTRMTRENPMRIIIYIIIIITRRDWWLSRKCNLPVDGQPRFRPLLYRDVDESSASDFANRLGEHINNTHYTYSVIEPLVDFNIDHTNGALYWDYIILCVRFIDINFLLYRHINISITITSPEFKKFTFKHYHWRGKTFTPCHAKSVHLNKKNIYPPKCDTEIYLPMFSNLRQKFADVDKPQYLCTNQN